MIINANVCKSFKKTNVDFLNLMVYTLRKQMIESFFEEKRLAVLIESTIHNFYKCEITR